MRFLPKELAKKLRFYIKDLKDINNTVKQFLKPPEDQTMHDIRYLTFAMFPGNINPTLREWKRDVKRLLINNLYQRIVDKFVAEEEPQSDTSPKEMIDIISSYELLLNSIISTLEKKPEDIMPISSSVKGEGEISKSKVFIVHGHDKVNLYELRDLLEKRYKLECTIMMWKPGKGRTLIEKFEQEAQDSGFAFILMTPDDQIALKEIDLGNLGLPTKKIQYAQARPNVIFELGWFHGRLGRNRVCILFKKGTQIHSDLAGVSRIEFQESVEEKIIEIEAELKATGLLENKGSK